MTRPLFDAALLPVRQARAEALGGDYFLHERAFNECLARIATMRKGFASAWLMGTERPDWHERLASRGISQVAFASLGGDLPTFAPDLCLSIGSLDTMDELPALLTALRYLIAPGALFIGAFVGGNSLPSLRSAMAAADQVDGLVRAHFHPLIDPASFGSLIASAGFIDPVVDLDRVALSYVSLAALVCDLRGMGVTNRLIERSRRPLSRRAVAMAKRKFASAGVNGRTAETVEIIHFAAWAPQAPVD